MRDFLPMAHTIGLLVFPDFELLDAAGPASVFTAANHALSRIGKSERYSVEILSPGGGLIRSSSGVALNTRALSEVLPTKVDTLLVAGGEYDGVSAAIADPVLQWWTPRCASAAERFGSVCSGAFVLAALGLLDGKRAATHWSACASLAELRPAVRVDPEALYVRDGRVWTSAGVATGIDMAVSMVSCDLGPEVAGEAAKRLVLYARRPGHQSQFSALLSAQLKADSPFADLIGWMQANLDAPLDVSSLAARVGLSERSFYRKFAAATGETPARFVETIRLDAARMLLSQGLSLKVIASKVGLSPAARLTEAFQRRFGIAPRLFRLMHSRS
jgi:transcriptional regulator GlxA family with amidase domain